MVLVIVLLLAGALRGLVPPWSDEQDTHPDDGADAHEVTVREAPELHALVRDVAALVGVAPPARLRLGTADNACVGRGLYRRDVELTIGLVLWGRLAWDARLALLGHELGHCLPRGGGHRAVEAAGVVLRGWLTVLWPTGYDVELARHRASWNRSASRGMLGGPVLVWLATVLQRLAAVPALVTLVLLDRLQASAAQRAEYASDVAAARVAGTDGAVALLSGLVDPRGWRTSVSAAVRRDEDVWAALARPAGDRSGRPPGCGGSPATRRCGSTPSHPPTALRLDLLERLPWQGPAAAMTPSGWPRWTPRSRGCCARGAARSRTGCSSPGSDLGLTRSLVRGRVLLPD